ncbi:MAG TPA: hypothetical protein ENK75_02615 [Saprospiraceae bacterium]|nr:hypothetical protein [Saprospiraceae bacterium]
MKRLINIKRFIILVVLPFVLLTAIHAERIFSQRHYFNIIGDMTMIGNSVMLDTGGTCSGVNVNN